ncbi:MAG: ATP-binding protein [Pseudomonadota bacterium]
MATFFLLLSLMPSMVLQIQAVADTILLLTSPSTPKPLDDSSGLAHKRDSIALFYTALIICFCMIFGAGYRQYRPLITTMAFESLVKLVALIIVGLFAIFGVFGGFGNLDLWLLENTEHQIRLYAAQQGSSAHTLLLIFTATGVLMPHIFHMSQMDKSINQVARMMTWAFPLFLLFMALPVFPILWAGFELNIPTPLAYFTLGVPQYANAPYITLIAWLGGLSAASGAIVLSLFSLATMILNQWLLPLSQLQTQKDIYAQIRWLRRLLVIIIAATSYALYLWLDNRYSLMDLALLAFIQALQFVPGIIAISYWPKANRFGFFAGISSGSLCWFIGLALPTLLNVSNLSVFFLVEPLLVGIESWEAVTLFSLGLNIISFVTFSYLSQSSEEEQYHADICAEDELSQPVRHTLTVRSVKEFKEKLSQSIGHSAAEKEVDKALKFLRLKENETRPYALRRLRTRIRTNLSGLLGHAMATDIIDKHFPYGTPSPIKAFDINLMENRLERLGHKMQGLTADVNQLRLHHRKTLQELPIAICSLGIDDEILLWNSTMTDITGISSQQVTGSNINDVPAPWGILIRDFANDWHSHTSKQSLDHKGNTHWYRLHKSAIQTATGERIEGQVILIEDITDIQLLEQELLQNTRLASIGRLAAGVAHEIGNPVTGIACLAQNLRYDNSKDERMETAQAILSQTDRINRIVQSLVTFAHTGRHSDKDFHPVNLYECADEAIHLLSLQQDRKAIEYSNTIEKDALSWGDSQRIIQVFINLLGNANDASPEYSTISLESRMIDDSIEIKVIDEGTGISKEHIKQVMEPFFTTKDTGKGTGLGLSIVFSIIEEHKGKMSIHSPVAQGRGTCFTLQLPIYRQEALISF